MQIRFPKALSDIAKCGLQCDFNRCLGDHRQVTRDFLQRSIAYEIVDADSQLFALAEAAKGAQHAGVVDLSVYFLSQLLNQFIADWAGPKRAADDVEQFGIGRQQIAEELRDAEDAQENFETAATMFEESRKLIAGDG